MAAISSVPRRWNIGKYFRNLAGVEHDPLEIWQNTQEVAGAALGRVGLRASDLAAVGITNQRETTVLWNRLDGKPLHNALVWQDTRVDQLVAEYVRQGGVNRFRAKTGLPMPVTSALSSCNGCWTMLRARVQKHRTARCCSAISILGCCGI